MYHLIRNLLFRFDAEVAHGLALNGLQLANQCQLLSLFYSQIKNPVHALHLNFPNRVGLAAGLDKNGRYIQALNALGFGFIEIGTVTPRPQIGNPKPRLFRLTQDEALINRMGFNNDGADKVAERLKTTNFSGILGINIGKNKDTPLDHAIDDYVTCFRKLHAFASYITLNISSPNTQGLRDLQHGQFFSALLDTMKKEQQTVLLNENKYVPLVIKIAPDLSDEALQEIGRLLLEKNIDAVIATNTTITRDHLSDKQYANEVGGLSGKPLHTKSTHAIKILHAILQDKIPIIASGGIMDVSSAKEKLNAGATLLQIYTGFIYHGPQLISQLAF